jgi:heme/copper-type cytochrome/quinol oxidase subunit 2
MARLAVPLSAAVSAGSQIGYLGASRAQMPDKRFFTVLAVEPRGGANVGQEPFPGETLPSGGGYVMRQPDQSGRWEVSAYVWAPSQIVVNEGDEVTLEFVGINGAVHPTEIKGIKAFTLKRGQVMRVEFKADRPGVHPVICGTHQPTMRGEIVVLPRA